MDGKEYRITLNEISVISMLISFALWGFYGYFNIYAIILESFFTLFAFIFLFLSSINAKIIYRKGNYCLLRYLLFLLPVLLIINLLKNIYIEIILIALIILILFIIQRYYNKTSLEMLDSKIFTDKNINKIIMLIISSISIAIIIITIFIKFPVDDEYLIDLYSAKQFLNGANPYLHSTTKNVFLVFNNFNLDYTTPTMFGKVITFMGYPALAFIAYIPYFFIGKINNTIIGLFSLIPLILIYKKFNDRKIAFLAVLSILLNFVYLYSAVDAVIGILWVSFLMVSYYFIYKNPILSGIFFGLSISAKQFAIFLFPFMIYMIYKEKGLKKAIQWLLIASIIFLIINAYFIILNPIVYINNILSPETDHLIGIGYGISQISFLGYIYMPQIVFTAIFIIVFILSIILYIKYYDLLKYELFAFPVLIFLFNYRVLPGYFIYWPILSLLVIEDIKYNRTVDDTKYTKNIKEIDNAKNNIIKINRKKLKKILYTSIIIFVIIIVIFAGINYYHKYEVNVNSIKPELANNNIKYIEVNLTYNGNSKTNLYFRAMPNETNYNGYLFNVSNNSILPGQTKAFYLYPVRGEHIPANTTIKLIVYDNKNLGYATYKLHDNRVNRIKNLSFIPPEFKISLKRI